MRILVCASEAPLTPWNGLRLQVSQLCAGLARDHDVSVLGFRHPGQSGAGPAGVELIEVPLPKASAALLASWLRDRDPAAALRLTPPMAAAAAAVLARHEFDVVHVTGANLARLAPALGARPAVLASLDSWPLNRAAVTAARPPLLRPLYGIEERRVRRFAASAYRPYDTVVFVTPEDAAHARSLDASLRVAVVPNGVDATHYAPDPAIAREPALVVLTGAMHYAPNVQAAVTLARDVMPLVRARRPDARLALVGRGPSPEVAALADLPGVEVTGEVPDVRPWLQRATVFACLMRSGTGIKNKLLEALACGVPAVVTPLATQGVPVRDGEHVLVAADGPAAADAIVALLDDPERAARLGAAGRRLVVEERSWDAVAAAYAEIYASAAARAGSAASRASSRA